MIKKYDVGVFWKDSKIFNFCSDHDIPMYDITFTQYLPKYTAYLTEDEAIIFKLIFPEEKVYER